MADDIETLAEDITSSCSMRSELINVYKSGLLSKLGIKVSEATIKKASEKNIEKMYNEYQTLYNTQIADDLVKNLLFGYTQGVKYLFPNVEQQKLHEKLNDNIIINNEIKKQLGQFMNPTILAAMSIGSNTAESIIVAPKEISEEK